MAATLPVESDASCQQGGRKARKQWSVQTGGPKGLLRRMRSQLAEDGCPESQLVMGRTLLDQLSQEGGDGEDGSAWEEEARLAVFWLTRASHQGSAEATQLLQHCLNTNTGICEHNYHEVRECLAMELQEKLARRAGRLLFASISDGNEMVSSSSLARKVQEVLAGEVAPPCSDMKGQQDSQTSTAPPETPNTANLEELYGGERLSEDHLVSAAVFHHQGCIPPLHHLLSLPLTPTHPHTRTTLHSLVHRPLKLLQDLYNACLQFLAVSLPQFARRYGVFVSVFSLVVLSVLFYVFGLRLSVFSGVLPVLVFCVGFVVMVASSSAILLNGKRLSCHRMWSRVFVHFCSELDVAVAERRFRAQCWRPYALLCVSVLVFVSAMPLIPHTLFVAFLPVLFVFGFLIFFLAVDRVELWHLVSLALYLLALNPGVVDVAGVEGVVAGTLKSVGVNEWVFGSSFQVWGGVNLNFGVGTILHLLWFMLQVCVGVVRGPTHLPSHLAGLAWAHLAVVGCSKVTAPQELMCPVAVWLVLTLVAAAASVTVLCVPLVLCAVVFKIGATQEMLAVTFLLCGCVAFLCQRLWPRLTSVMFRVTIVCAVILLLLRPNAAFSPAPPQHSTLQWDVYKNVCAAKTTQAENVHGCAPLIGTAVRWRGSITQVTVTTIRNIPLKILSFLPAFLEGPVKCYLGRRLPECNSKDATTQNRCLAIRSALGGSACSLDEWNEFMFAVKLGMQESYWKFGVDAEVSLHADHTFANFMMGLREGDVVEFTGTMTAGVGTDHLSLSLSAIKCVTCKLKANPVDVVASPAVSPTLPLSLTLREAARGVFNFILAPTLTL